MNPAFKQIGNAVPALLAKAIADNIYKILMEKHVAKVGAKEAQRV
jgi:DNA (cytosine-5)-methyltransferase 1